MTYESEAADLRASSLRDAVNALGDPINGNLRLFPKHENNKLARLGMLQSVSESTSMKDILELHVLQRAFQLLRSHGVLNPELVADKPVDPEVYQALLVLAQNARPSSGKGRVQAEGFLGASTANPSILYTVPNGYRLFVTSLNLSVDNAAGTLGEFHVRDGPLIPRIPFLVTKNLTINIDSTFPEPKVFLRDVRLIPVSGTLTFAGSFTGYLELL